MLPAREAGFFHGQRFPLFPSHRRSETGFPQAGASTCGMPEPLKAARPGINVTMRCRDKTCNRDSTPSTYSTLSRMPSSRASAISSVFWRSVRPLFPDLARSASWSIPVYRAAPSSSRGCPCWPPSPPIVRGSASHHRLPRRFANRADLRDWGCALGWA